MRFENTEVWGFKHAIRGMRNPKDSWDRSDSSFDGELIIGPNDMKLMKALISGGSEHRKFLRQIFISVDITAPFYWWKEFDTYKVGTVANSCSTMHKLDAYPITLDNFETDDYHPDLKLNGHAIDNITIEPYINSFIHFCELLRQKYLETKDKRYWKELVRWLPNGWLQKRTITMNYENVFSMIHQRSNHKQNEWSGKDDPDLTNFIAWAHTLPYADELLFNMQPAT